MYQSLLKMTKGVMPEEEQKEESRATFCIVHLLPAVEVRPIEYRICWRDDGTRCVCTAVHFYRDGRAIDVQKGKQTFMYAYD